MKELACKLLAHIFYTEAKLTLKLILPGLIVMTSCLSQARYQNRLEDSELNKAQGQKTTCIPDWNRSFESYPSVIVKKNFRKPVFFVGDIHGELHKIHPLLFSSGIVGGAIENPIWKGQNSIVVVMGDVIDKGPNSIDTIRYLMNLETQAPTAGGEVIVIAGNHEIGFLLDPGSDKAKEFREEIKEKGLDLCNDVYSSKSEIGRWLRNRPAAVKINHLFASHTGFPRWTLTEIDLNYKELFSSNGLSRKFSCGDDDGRKKHKGFFTARSWWEKEQKFLTGLQNLDVMQIIFAHDPNAFDDRGQIMGYFGDQFGRALIKVDIGLSIGDSPGELLVCEAWSSQGICSDFSSRKMAKNPLNLEINKIPLIGEYPPDPKDEDIDNDC